MGFIPTICMCLGQKQQQKLRAGRNKWMCARARVYVWLRKGNKACRAGKGGIYGFHTHHNVFVKLREGYW